jgi:hypothetical protein
MSTRNAARVAGLGRIYFAEAVVVRASFAVG